ncbi:MAG: carboxypeptidase-like regulatory domain-containing protein [Candidatus Acidiferrales bacterium]
MSGKRYLQWLRCSAIGVVLLIGVISLTPTSAQAQVSTASVNGVVQDPSGAVVPEVSVVLHNVATGVDHATVTNSDGNYVLLNIPPGRYSLKASKSGFAASTRLNITLTVDQSATFNFQLVWGPSPRV